MAADFSRGVAVSGSDDLTIRVWDLALGTCSSVLQARWRVVGDPMLHRTLWLCMTPRHVRRALSECQHVLYSGVER